MRRIHKAVFPVFLPALLAVVHGTALAQAPATPAPGEYITEAGWGVLTITRSKDQPAHFSLEATGANAHSCTLDGDILEGRATLGVDPPVPGEPRRDCVVLFHPNAEGIEVSSDERYEDIYDDPCRAFCGMRAYFAGEYLTPAPGCTGAERAATRERFQRLYDAKSYTEAEAVLEPLLERCGKTLGEEKGWIANDLALTQYHLGRLADCRKTLAPLAGEAARSDVDLRGSLPPFDFEVHFPLIQATRHNLELCARKGHRSGARVPDE
jgi:hypothetical protein